MDARIQPKLFISYARADGESIAQDFWERLRTFLVRSERKWEKWDYKEILVGQAWDETIMQALKEECSCCLLLVSDLFATSSYIIDKEWPTVLKRNQEEGIFFFPVVFGLLEAELTTLPEKLSQFQLYWPTVADVYTLPPSHILNPDKTRLSYKDIRTDDTGRDYFLSRLASQMNARFDQYQKNQEAKPPPPDPAQFITNASNDETLAKAIFGSFSYEKRYRDSLSKDHYFPRYHIDSELDTRLGRGDWVLTAGHPLAGKTRAVFEAIKRLMASGRSVIVWPFKMPERGQRLLLPTFPKANHRIVWMDDIDTWLHDLAKHGYSTSDINCFLRDIADAGIMLAATIRTGPSYYDFRHRFGLDEHLWDKLESLTMPRLAGDEEKAFTGWYEASFGESLPDRFDHHPGSLFLNLEAMGKRWRCMHEIAKDHQLKPNVGRAKDIMRALHVFYVMGAYRPGGLFLEENILFYLRRKEERKQESTTLRAAFAKDPSSLLPFSSGEWDGLVEFLSQDTDHLGFLRREGGYLLTETAYLDHIIAPDGERDMVQNITKDFSDEDKRRLGLVVTGYNFGEVFRDSPLKTKDDLVKLTNKLKPLGLERDIVVWTQLVNLCPQLPLAQQAVTMLKGLGLAPNVVTYNTLVAKAETYATAQAIVAEMKTAGIRPDVFTYSTLVAKAKTYATAQAIVAEMKTAGIRPNVVTYSTLVAKAKRDETP